MFKQLTSLFYRQAKLVKYPEPMSLEKVKNIFQEQGDNANIWQALDTIIDALLLDAVNDCSDANNDACKLAHAGGRVDALSQLKSRIDESRKK